MQPTLLQHASVPRGVGHASEGGVLHVLNGLPFGGNQTLCLQLMARFPSGDRTLLNIGPDGPMRTALEALPGCRIYDEPYRPSERLRFVWRVRELLSRLRPRAIIVGPFGLHLFVALAGRLAGVPRVFARAGNPVPADDEQRVKWRRIVWASAVLGTPIISCSRYVDAEFRRLSRLVPPGSRAIPNGLDTRAIRDRASAARARRADRRPVIGMVARLNAIKDQETLVRAMPLVRAKHPDVRAWIVGEGETRPHLEKLVAELELESTVEFLGKRADVPELLGQMDVYAFSTTREEGFGIALVEAMAAGLPIVAADVPSTREILEKSGGLLVPRKDPRALADALILLLEDAAERERWAERASLAVESFSLERCADEWREVLQGIPERR